MCEECTGLFNDAFPGSIQYSYQISKQQTKQKQNKNRLSNYFLAQDIVNV